MIHHTPKGLAVPIDRLVHLYLDGCTREAPLSVASSVKALRAMLPGSSVTDRELGELVARRAVARGMPVVVFDLGRRQH